MSGRIHLVLHAESVHNVDKDFNRLDPELTTSGRQQAQLLGPAFSYSNDVGLIITSPLRRTIQTTLLAFTKVLDKRYYANDLGNGIDGGIELLLDADLQERSALPCDTGSDRGALEGAFPGLDVSMLPEGWTSKKGTYAADDEAVEERAAKVRGELRKRFEALKQGERQDVVVITHGVFMKFLSVDKEIDLPKAGWKSFTIEEGEGGDAVIVLV
jgi:broad specificity phosphatase PhoE